MSLIILARHENIKMAKIRKNLDYLPLDVNIFADRKIKRLTNTFGGKGFLVYIIILTEVYKNGYFLVWDNDYPEDIAMMLGEGIKANLVMEVVNHCVHKFGLFDRELFDNSIITSKGIQQRYLHAKESICKKTFKLEELFPKYCLLDDNENLSELTPINGDYPENVRNEPINADERRQVKSSKVKSSKVEVKENNSPLSPQGETENSFSFDVPESLNFPQFLAAWKDWEKYRREKRQTLKPTTVKKQLDFLASLGPERAVKSINQSIMQGWTGLFEPKEETALQQTRPTETVSISRQKIIQEFLDGK